MREQIWAPGSAAVNDHLLSGTGPAISPEARLVYLKLFSHMDEYDMCWPAVGTLMRGTGLSERTVQRRLRELEAVGLVEQHHRAGEPTLYRLYPPWNPRHADTPVSVTPPTEGHPPSGRHPRQRDTPVRETPDPRQSDTPPPSEGHPTPVTLTPEVTQGTNPTKEPNEDPAPAAVPGPASPPVETINEDLLAGWERVLGHLQRVMPRSTWEGWARPARPVETRGRALVLEVEAQFAAQKLQRNWGLVIGQALNDVSRGRLTEIQVRVRGQPAHGA